MSKDMYAAIIFGCVAVGLLFADRIYRINPYLLSEGFVSGGGAYTRCGTDLPPCPFPTRCMNGICGQPEKMQLRDRNPLPVLPPAPTILPGVSDMASASTLPSTWGINLQK